MVESEQVSRGAKIDEELSRALIPLSSFITAQITLHVISMLQSLPPHTRVHTHTHAQYFCADWRRYTKDFYILSKITTFLLQVNLMTPIFYLPTGFGLLLFVQCCCTVLAAFSHFLYCFCYVLLILQLFPSSHTNTAFKVKQFKGLRLLQQLSLCTVKRSALPPPPHQL